MSRRSPPHHVVVVAWFRVWRMIVGHLDNGKVDRILLRILSVDHTEIVTFGMNPAGHQRISTKTLFLDVTNDRLHRVDF
jgi:hypothetical protein